MIKLESTGFDFSHQDTLELVATVQQFIYQFGEISLLVISQLKLGCRMGEHGRSDHAGSALDGVGGMPDGAQFVAILPG
jgi:hypothetical protein